MMEGIYTTPNENSFKSKQEIIRDSFLATDHPAPEFATPLPETPTFRQLSERFIKRSDEAIATKQERNSIHIKFPRQALIALVGDIHAGSAHTNYRRVEDEMNAIQATPGAYVGMIGDAIDGFFFNPAQMEAIEQVPEQFLYYRSMLLELADKSKLLFGVGGDHDQWSAKMGVSANARFSEELGAYYIHGIGRVLLEVGGIMYKTIISHRMPGFSMYNSTHGQNRMARFGVQGADLYISGHTHRKGLAKMAVQDFEGSREVTLMSIGPYKFNDEYGRKLGFPDMQGNTDEMFGQAVILSDIEKKIDPYNDIVGACDMFQEA